MDFCRTPAANILIRAAICQMRFGTS
ncbi:hypothetical protein OOU_Y34scaffold00435g6 [Pyricularia oryzae Y34]|uniref:Uncharacterized protein n=2 Tax=Pyricularia oryzae TaxID=318829 RepID=A0AA97P1U4_PYRO3|nr:hypothetical protein OOU_Y34scaffold00435g6 [Pyricularia oryzae Y34]